ncbi:MAG: molybdenum ABC transporter permease [Thermoplasmata archaeon HGW-Thermoplasmata-1]|nr:MAG: molybdenum ABC transporter permease [Thermoplasmata archaeon HGW-Thermoplasmata-1]
MKSGGAAGAWFRTREPVMAVFTLLGTVAILFVALPVVAMVMKETPQSIWETLKDGSVRRAIYLSASTALWATLASLLVGVPLGYLLARKRFWGKELIQSVADLPVVIPHTVAGIALLTIFGAKGMIGAPLSEWGVRFVDAQGGIVVAMVFVSMSFVINSARNGFEAVDPRLEKIARSLGSSRAGAFFRVSLPLAAPSIASGAVMCWARAISEFGAVIVIAYFPMIAPTLIYDRFLSFGLDASRPIAVVLVLICILLFASLRLITRRRSKA